MFKKKENKKNNFDMYLWVFLIYIVVFVLLPYILMQFKDITPIAYVLLLYVNPIICTIFGAISTYRIKFQPLEAIIPMIAFLFAIILIYNSSALIYVPFYGIMYYAGCAIGGYARFKESEDYKKPGLFERIFKKK